MQIIEVQTEIVQLGLDLGAVMALVAERVERLTGAGGAVVEMAEGDEMVYRAASGMAKGQLGLRLRRQGSLSGLCIAESRVLSCSDSETDPRVDREACRKVGLRSMLCAPLLHAGAPVGVLKIASSVQNAFQDQHVHTLELMSGLVAAAMSNASKHESNELYHRATHDALTGLANRALFYDRLRQDLARADRYSAKIGVLNLDMDGLKPINDEHGHRAGDAAIREMATRIAKGSRRSDTVARVGGDEFGVILTEVSNRESAASLAERLEREIASPFEFEGQTLPLGASIGLAVYPDDGAEIETLVESADRSMYATKRTRKGRRQA